LKGHLHKFGSESYIIPIRFYRQPDVLEELENRNENIANWNISAFWLLLSEWKFISDSILSFDSINSNF